jgi:hypothetical protein
LEKPAKALALSKLTVAQRSMLARAGKVDVTVRVAGGGTLSVHSRGRISGKSKTLSRARRVVLKESPTTLKITLKLSSAARHELSRRHRLHLTVQARLSGLVKAATATINLTRTGR